jgi:hypothetical protein
VSLTLIGAIVAAVLTLMVFSYLVGNNPLYRLAQHIFVGVSIGYAALLLLGNVLVPRIFQLALVTNFGTLGWWLLLVPIVLGLMLLARLGRVAPAPGQRSLLLGLATLALNIALSTVAALAIAGALTGTIIPQTAGTMLPLSSGDVAGNAVIVVGVIASLFYFQFNVRPSGVRSGLGTLVAGTGRWVIVIALGATLGALTVSFVSALVERVQFLFNLPNLF